VTAVKTERKILTDSDSDEDRERKIVTAVKTMRKRKVVTDSDSGEYREGDSHGQ